MKEQKQKQAQKELEIRKGIPIPSPQVGKKGWSLRHPISLALVKMVTGDSIDVPVKPGTYIPTLRGSIHTKAKATKSKIVIRLLTDGNGNEFLRVWKLKQLP